jgi:hypothetical protein
MSKEIKSRYSLKNIDSSKYMEMKIDYQKSYTFDTSNKVDKPEMETIQKPNKVGYIDFLDIKVPIYYDKDFKDFGISWQCRNPDAFYTGIVYINWETGILTYPEGLFSSTSANRNKKNN